MIDLPDISRDYLLVAAALAIAFAVRVQFAVGALREQLADLSLERADPLTSLLPQNAIPLRLEPELAWADLEHVKVGIVAFQVYGGDHKVIARALRAAMRGEENAYLLRGDRYVAGLWRASEEGMHLGVRRLGATMLAAGADVVEAGVAMFPDDSRDLDELMAIASQQQRPLDQQSPPRDTEVQGPRRARGPVARGLRLLASMWVGLACSLGALAMAYVAFPLALSEAGGIVAGLPALMLVAVGLVVAVWGVWNHGSSREPDSAGSPRANGRVLGWCGALAATLLLWSFVQIETANLPFAFGAIVVFDALLLLVVVEGRFLVRMPGVVNIALALLAAGVVLATYDQLPAVASFGRIVGSLFVGAVLARMLERIAWVAALTLTISAVDCWSVFSSEGTTNKLASSGSSLLDVLLIQAPSVDAQPVFYLGTVDVIFSAVFICFAHFWRLDVVRVSVALLLGLVTAVVVSMFVPDIIPVLPFLSLAFLAAAGRSVLRDVRLLLAGDAPEESPPATTTLTATVVDADAPHGGHAAESAPEAAGPAPTGEHGTTDVVDEAPAPHA